MRRRTVLVPYHRGPMRRVPCLVLLLTLLTGCERRSVAVEPLSIENNVVVLNITNDTSGDVVLLSPESPRRRADEQTCTLALSTVVDNIVRPFSFSPQLAVIRARTSARFAVKLEPVALTAKCRDWRVAATYAYVTPSAVHRFRNRPEAFRQYVLKNQRVAAATVVLPVRPTPRRP